MNPGEPSAPVRVARYVIETFVRGGRIPRLEEVPPLDIPGLADARAACFVSLHRRGELRGCIGTVQPTMACLGSEIIRNAVSACSEDPRFDPVGADELSDLEISVDILGESEVVSGPEELDPRKYGVIVTSGYRRGLLLPDLEGVDTVRSQLAIACRKGGIDPGESFEIRRFTVTRYH